MTMNEIQKRLDEIETQWIKAGRDERARLVIERLRLERQADNLRRVSR